MAESERLPGLPHGLTAEADRDESVAVYNAEGSLAALVHNTVLLRWCLKVQRIDSREQALAMLGAALRAQEGEALYSEADVREALEWQVLSPNNVKSVLARLRAQQPAPRPQPSRDELISFVQAVAGSVPDLTALIRLREEARLLIDRLRAQHPMEAAQAAEEEL